MPRVRPACNHRTASLSLRSREKQKKTNKHERERETRAIALEGLMMGLEVHSAMGMNSSNDYDDYNP
jgi:hypothetical protein